MARFPAGRVHALERLVFEQSLQGRGYTGQRPQPQPYLKWSLTRIIMPPQAGHRNRSDHAPVMALLCSC
jgi:hypothetical protein